MNVGGLLAGSHMGLSAIVPLLFINIYIVFFCSQENAAKVQHCYKASNDPGLKTCCELVSEQLLF